ncbi:DUF5634 family protein [Priestia megaterium]|uniref:DUF5634 family protein n=1 Tax=Priestia megaterium TaxID=1404 RepID=UPI0038733748|nr:DUF5634 family protein [Priestia megaterium]
MEYVKRETAISELTHHMDDILNKYNLQGVSVYEEEGEGNHYYLGYTVKKDDHVFMLNRPYIKDKDGKLGYTYSTVSISFRIECCERLNT